MLRPRPPVSPLPPLLGLGALHRVPKGVQVTGFVSVLRFGRAREQHVQPAQHDRQENAHHAYQAVKGPKEPGRVVSAAGHVVCGRYQLWPGEIQTG